MARMRPRDYAEIALSLRPLAGAPQWVKVLWIEHELKRRGLWREEIHELINPILLHSDAWSALPHAGGPPSRLKDSGAPPAQWPPPAIDREPPTFDVTVHHAQPDESTVESDRASDTPVDDQATGPLGASSRYETDRGPGNSPSPADDCDKANTQLEVADGCLEEPGAAPPLLEPLDNHGSHYVERNPNLVRELLFSDTAHDLAEPAANEEQPYEPEDVASDVHLLSVLARAEDEQDEIDKSWIDWANVREPGPHNIDAQERQGQVAESAEIAGPETAPGSDPHEAIEQRLGYGQSMDGADAQPVSTSSIEKVAAPKAASTDVTVADSATQWSSSDRKRDAGSAASKAATVNAKKHSKPPRRVRPDRANGSNSAEFSTGKTQDEKLSTVTDESKRKTANHTTGRRSDSARTATEGDGGLRSQRNNSSTNRERAARNSEATKTASKRGRKLSAQESVAGRTSEKPTASSTAWKNDASEKKSVVDRLEIRGQRQDKPATDNAGNLPSPKRKPSRRVEKAPRARRLVARQQRADSESVNLPWAGRVTAKAPRLIEPAFVDPTSPNPVEIPIPANVDPVPYLLKMSNERFAASDLDRASAALHQARELARGSKLEKIWIRTIEISEGIIQKVDNRGRLMFRMGERRGRR